MGRFINNHFKRLIFWELECWQRLFLRPLLLQHRLCRHQSLFVLSLLCMLYVTTGCSPAPMAQWQDYQARLARVLDEPLTSPSPSEQPPLAAVAPVMFETRIGLLDAAALHTCGLDQLIGERNNVLGKVMVPAVQLDYELRLLAALPACIDHSELTPALKQSLNTVRALKQQQLIALWQHVLLKDDALLAQWQGRAQAILDSRGRTQSVEALTTLVLFSNQLQQLSQQPSPVSANQWQELQAMNLLGLLATLHQTQHLAMLRYSLQQHLLALSSLNEQLTHASRGWSSQKRRKICQQQEIWQTVLAQIFIPNLQSQLAEVDISASQLLPLWQQLYQQTPYEPHIAQRFPQAQLQQQLRQHVGWWTDLQQQCSPPPPH